MSYVISLGSDEEGYIQHTTLSSIFGGPVIDEEAVAGVMDYFLVSMMVSLSSGS